MYWTCCLEKTAFAKHMTRCSIVGMVQKFGWTTGFYWSYTLLLKPFVLMRSLAINHVCIIN